MCGDYCYATHRLNYHAKPKYGDGYEFSLVVVDLMEAGFAEDYSVEECSLPQIYLSLTSSSAFAK